MRYTVNTCAIVVLAAGRSSRLGSPKQLLPFNGKSLVQHAVDAALQTKLRPVVVVTGANSEAINRELNGRLVFEKVNAGWEEGIASSLRCGLKAARQMEPQLDGIIFMVCDQPYVEGSLLESLLQVQHETGLPIVASRYEDILGTPALFHKSLFEELMKLKGDAGARKLIQQQEDLVITISFPKGIVDIDTAADYALLKTPGE